MECASRYQLVLHCSLELLSTVSIPPLFVGSDMASDQSSSLYGAPRPKTRPSNTVSSSASSAFASHLSSLLAAPSSKPTTTSARPRPSKTRKDDIFTSHNKGSKKRALADLATTDDGTQQKHKTDIGALDSSDLHRSKRKMEEKARLYAAMKRGDYVAPKSSLGYSGEERAPLVDFDRKWAEAEAEGKDQTYDTSSDDGGNSEEEELVDYIDELGRNRKGTRAEAAREERRQRMQRVAKEELQEMSARPTEPVEQAGNLIFGDTIQYAAFNPDAPIAAQMAELAARRDRSMTPPEDTHYDASKEVRSKGVGFYQFSKDKESRGQEMEALKKEREETERLAKEREDRRSKKQREIEERRRKIKEKRDEKEADRFLNSLG